MEKINNPAYKFYMKVNSADRIDTDYYASGFFTTNMNAVNYYPYENFNGLSLNEIRIAIESKNITLLGVIDTTKITDRRVSFRTVWSRKIVLNDSEQSINEIVMNTEEKDKVYDCFINRYCQKEQKAKVKEKK